VTFQQSVEIKDGVCAVLEYGKIKEFFDKLAAGQSAAVVLLKGIKVSRGIDRTIQATLVAIYGTKPARLAEVLRECQRLVANVFGDSFAPYDIDQIHATIVGLEQIPKSPQLNRNLSQSRDRLQQMDLPGFLSSLKANPCSRSVRRWVDLTIGIFHSPAEGKDRSIGHSQYRGQESCSWVGR